MVDTFECARAEVFHNPGKLTPAQIRKRTGCTHIVNGYLFNTKFKPLGWTVIDGKIISRDAYTDWGISIGHDGRPKMLTDRGGTFLSGIPILKGGAKLYRGLTPDVARAAARTAIGWLPNGKVVLWCDRAAMTREQLQNKLLGLGVENALMLDGGGSTQGIFPGGTVTSTRRVPTLLLFWEGVPAGTQQSGPGGETTNSGESEKTPQGGCEGYGACEEASEGGKPVVTINAYSKKLDGAKKLSTNFKVSEFACNDGSDAILVAPRLVMVLQSIRSHFGAAVTINSAYRTPQWNEKQGGAATSQHCYGTAADIVVKGKTPAQVAAYAREIMPDWGGVGIYDRKGFTHIDVREARADWKE